MLTGSSSAAYRTGTITDFTAFGSYLPEVKACSVSARPSDAGGPGLGRTWSGTLEPAARNPKHALDKMAECLAKLAAFG
jgi:hypothetical protein